MSEKLDDTIIPFGKYKGEKLNDIDLKYLDWCIGQDFVKIDYPDFYEKLVQYMSDPVIERELEQELELEEENEYDEE